MGFLSSVLWGGAIGISFWAYLPQRYFNTIDRNIGKPVYQEYSKDVVDLTKILKIIFGGTIVSVKEIASENKD